MCMREPAGEIPDPGDKRNPDSLGLLDEDEWLGPSRLTLDQETQEVHPSREALASVAHDGPGNAVSARRA